MEWDENGKANRCREQKTAETDQDKPVVRYKVLRRHHYHRKYRTVDSSLLNIVVFEDELQYYMMLNKVATWTLSRSRMDMDLERSSSFDSRWFDFPSPNMIHKDRFRSSKFLSKTNDSKRMKSIKIDEFITLMNVPLPLKAKGWKQDKIVKGENSMIHSPGDTAGPSRPSCCRTSQGLARDNV